MILIKTFLQIANALPEALILIDGEGTILAVNKKASCFLKVSSGELTNRSLIEFVENSEESLSSSMRLWRRSKSPIPASIKWKEKVLKETSNVDCHAFLLQPALEKDKALVVIRCIIGQSMTRKFTELNFELGRQKVVLQNL